MNLEEIPKTKKIYAHIPLELFLKLREKNLLNSHFDEFVAKALIKLLEDEENDRNI